MLVWLQKASSSSSFIHRTDYYIYYMLKYRDMEPYARQLTSSAHSFSSPHGSARHTGRLSYSFNFSASTLCYFTCQPNFWKALLTLALLFQASLERQSLRIWGEGRESFQTPSSLFQGSVVQPYMCGHLHYETMVLTVVS